MSDTPHNNPPCMIRFVVVEPGARGAIIHDKTGDHNEPYFRDWITKTEWWALRNGKITSKAPVA